MTDDNLYRAPAFSPEDAPVAEQPATRVMFTPGGSSLEIGPRREFTSRWIRKIYMGPIVAGLFVLPLFLVDGPLDRFEQSFLALFVVAIASEVTLRSMGLPPIAGEDPERLARARGGLVVDLVFSPRLPVSGWEAMDTADDIGVLWVEEQQLHFEGDRCRMRLDRGDVRRVGRRREAVSILSGYGLDALVELERELTGQGSFHLSPREVRKKSRARRRGQKLRSFIDAWFDASDE